jgi:SHS2 domain-containing protein
MYEIFEHTADLGIRIRADNVDELFVDAAHGLFSVMVANPDLVHATEETTFQLRTDNIEELLHDWLSELVYTFYARRLVLADFQVQVRIAKACELTATARGEPFDPGRHETDVEVKAITWHELKVEQLPDGWEAEVIVDI